MTVGCSSLGNEAPGRQAFPLVCVQARFLLPCCHLGGDGERGGYYRGREPSQWGSPADSAHQSSTLLNASICIQELGKSKPGQGDSASPHVNASQCDLGPNSKSVKR